MLCDLRAIEEDPQHFLSYGRVSTLHADGGATTLLLHAPAFVLDDMATATARMRVDCLWDALRFENPPHGERFYHLGRERRGHQALPGSTTHNKRQRHMRHQSMRMEAIARHATATPGCTYVRRTLTLTPAATELFDVLQTDHPETSQLCHLIKLCLRPAPSPPPI